MPPPGCRILLRLLFTVDLTVHFETPEARAVLTKSPVLLFHRPLFQQHTPATIPIYLKGLLVWHISLHYLTMSCVYQPACFSQF